MRVKFTRKHLYINRVGVKVKGEGKKSTSTEVRMRGRVSCRPRVGKGRRVVHFRRKGVDFGVKVVLFPSSRQGGRRGSRKVGQRPVGLSMGAPPPIGDRLGSATAHSGAK